ncbi:hypothetical protein [Streptomyces sp. 2A115]|uniref:hypothetical protein n=1 Tax=Streptomyces sp. 2A115 TaxID=3457439 RepID=UPI003FD33D8D
MTLGNDWIAIGDALYEKAQAMDGAMNAMGWTGSAGTAARAAWRDGERGVYQSLSTSADAAWKIGESLHIYAEELQKTIHEINKQRVVAALANVFGLALGGLMIELGPLIGAMLSAVRGILANMLPWFARLAAALAKTGAAGAFVSNAAIGAAMSLGFDVITQLLAHAAAGEQFHGVNWKDEAINMALGAEAAFVGGHWSPGPNRSAGAAHSVPSPKGTPTRSSSPTNLPKTSVVLPISGAKVPLPDFISKGLALPPYGPARHSESEFGATGPQGETAHLDPAAAGPTSTPTAASAKPAEAGAPDLAPVAHGAGPQAHSSGRPDEGGGPTRASSAGPSGADPGSKPAQSFPGSGNTIDIAPAARTNPADNQPTTINTPPIGPGTSNPNPTPPRRTGIGYDRPADLNTLPPTTEPTPTTNHNPFPGTGNTINTTPAARTNPADNQPTTINTPPLGPGTPNPNPPPPRRTGIGYDRPADLNTLPPTTTHTPFSVIGKTPTSSQNHHFPGTGNTIDTAPGTRTNPADNQPTGVNIPPVGSGTSPGTAIRPLREGAGYQRPATLDDIGAHSSGDGRGGSGPSGAGYGTTMNHGSNTVTLVVHEKPRPTQHDGPHLESDPAAVSTSHGGGTDTAPPRGDTGHAPDRSSETMAPEVSASAAPEPAPLPSPGAKGNGPVALPSPGVKGGEPTSPPAADTAPAEGTSTPGPVPGAKHADGSGAVPGGNPRDTGPATSLAAAPSATVPSSTATAHTSRLDIDAARATLGDVSLSPDTVARATVQASAILGVRWHEVQPSADPLGAAPLVPRPQTGPIGTGYTRALDLVTAQVVQHGPLTAQATAASILPGAARSTERPMLLFGEPSPAGDALHLGEHRVPLTHLSSWLPAHTGWSAGGLVVLPIPDAAVPTPQGGASFAQRLADHIGSPVLAPDGPLHVSSDGRLVTDGPEGWIESLPHRDPVVRSPELGQSLFARNPEQSPSVGYAADETAYGHSGGPEGTGNSSARQNQERSPDAPARSHSAVRDFTVADLLPQGALDIDLTPELTEALADAVVRSLRARLEVPTGTLGSEIRFVAPADGAQRMRMFEVTQQVAVALDQSIPVVRGTDGGLLVKICPPGE